MSAAAPPGDTAPVLVVATANEGKLRELRRLLAAHPVRVVGLREAGWVEELEEPGATYAENALAKASVVAGRLGLPALADDSGIEVEALRGWPGPLSARWLGHAAGDDERLRALIDEVRRRCPGERQVRYVCVVALVRPGAEPATARGDCLGTLVEPRGLGGFGYDPGFLSEDLGTTFGEASDADKDRVSHRARALRRLGEAGLLDPSPWTP